MTLIAAFSRAEDAERAAGALLDHGYRADDLSIVLGEKGAEARAQETAEAVEFSHPTTLMGPAGQTGRFDPMGNDLRQVVYVPHGNNFPAGETAQVNARGPLADRPNNDKAEGDELVTDLNPAQNDYPRSGSASPTELSSVPPNARRDYNPDLDTREYNANYQADTDEERRDDLRRDRERANAPGDALSDRGPEEGPETTVGPRGIGSAGGASTEPNRQADLADAGVPLGPTLTDPERAAKAGVTTTTLEDAATAAKKGVGLGLGVGALAAVAALTVPGFGVVLGGGALATALAGLAASAGAGALAGGVVGFLKDQGVPGDRVEPFQRAVTDGGALLTVKGASAVATGPLGADAVRNLLAKYGATDVHAIDSVG